MMLVLTWSAAGLNNTMLTRILAIADENHSSIYHFYLNFAPRVEYLVFCSPPKTTEICNEIISGHLRKASVKKYNEVAVVDEFIVSKLN